MTGPLKASPGTRKPDQPPGVKVAPAESRVKSLMWGYRGACPVAGAAGAICRSTLAFLDFEGRVAPQDFVFRKRQIGKTVSLAGVNPVIRADAW